MPADNPAHSSAVDPLPEPSKHAPDRNLALELVRVTEAAAMAAGRWVGRGDKNGADGAAVNAMRPLINTVSMNGVVVIGEGEKDEAPMLFNGERGRRRHRPGVRRGRRPGRRHHAERQGHAERGVGAGGRRRGARCTTRRPCSTWTSWSPGPEAAGMVDISAPRRAQHRRRWPGPRAARRSDVTVVILDRPRHEGLVKRGPGGRRADQVHHRRRRGRRDHGRAGGHRRRPAARHRRHARGHHRGLRAQVPRRRDPGQAVAEGRRRAAQALDAGHDLDRVLTTDDLVSGDDVFFVATGITDGELMRGVRYRAAAATTHSLVMRSTVRHHPQHQERAPAVEAARLQLDRLRLDRPWLIDPG